MALNSDGDADFFSGIGLKYEEAFGHDPGLHDFIEASLNRLPSRASVLELGSGTGRPTAEKVIERRGFSLHGIDISPVMVEIARRQVPQATFQEANMLEYEPELNHPGYDAIFTVFSIFHFARDEMNVLTRRLATWLKPGGFLFIGTMVADDFQTTPGMWDLDGHCARGIPHTFMGRCKENLLYSRKGWEELLSSAGFKIVETKMVAFQAPPEAQAVGAQGSSTGTAIVIDCISLRPRNPVQAAAKRLRQSTRAELSEVHCRISQVRHWHWHENYLARTVSLLSAMAQIHVGVLALQGAFLEHLQLFQIAAKSGGLNDGGTTWSFSEVRNAEQLAQCEALVIPGGESTTMALVAERSGLLEPLRNFVKVERRPTWGTCAGLILLAESANRTKKGGQDLIGGLDVRVNRNHFGRQTESFETDLTLPFLSKENEAQAPFRTVFIRAPIVEKILPVVQGEQLAEAAREDTVTAPSKEALDHMAKKAIGQPVEVLATLPGRRTRLVEMHVEVEPGNDAGDIVAVRQGNVFGCSFHPELTMDPRIHVWWLHQVKAAVTERSSR